MLLHRLTEVVLVHRYGLNGDAVPAFPADKVKFMYDNEAWVDAQCSSNPDSAYWQQVRLLNAQVRRHALRWAPPRRLTRCDTCCASPTERGT